VREIVDALEEGQRRSVVCGDGERRSKSLSRLVPLLFAVRSEALRVVFAECDLRRRQCARPSQYFEHGLWPGLPEHDQAIDFANLDGAARGGDRALRDQRAGAVFLVRSLQP